MFEYDKYSETLRCDTHAGTPDRSITFKSVVVTILSSLRAEVPANYGSVSLLCRKTRERKRERERSTILCVFVFTQIDRSIDQFIDDRERREKKARDERERSIFF